MNHLQDKNILIIDDESKIVEIVKAYLERENANVFCAYSGRDGLEAFENNAIDLIVLDLMLPDVQGEEICRKVRQKSDTPIIMLTAKVEEADELTGLGLGADDYVAKPFNNKILMARIDSLLRRTDRERKLFYTDGILEVSLENKAVKKNGVNVVLTRIELNILIELIKSPEKTFTRDELIAFALHNDYDGFDRTIDSHIKKLRKKIEDNPKNPQYIMTVHGIGYKFNSERLTIHKSHSPGSGLGV